MPITTEPTDYGYRAVFTDPVTVADVQGWVEAVRSLTAARSGFGQVIDMRHHDQAGREAELTHALRDAMVLIRGWGLRRSALIVADQITARRLMRRAACCPAGTEERFIEGCHPDWEEATRAWIRSGIEPWESLPQTCGLVGPD